MYFSNMYTFKKIDKLWTWMWTHSPVVLKDGTKQIEMRRPTSLFPPFADFTTFFIIVCQCVWTYLFIKLELSTQTDVTIVVGILAGTLGFILPLQLNSALSKNANCLNNYNAFTGDLIALCWDIIAFYKSNQEQARNDKNIQRLFNVICAMPALAKHNFRGTLDLTKATTIDDKVFINHLGGQEVDAMMKSLNGDGMTVVDVCFYKLLDYLKDLLPDDAKTRGFMIKSWERAYGSWGNMSNLNAYKPPSIFTNVLNVALALYSLLLPFTLVGQGYHAIWMVAIIGYFFLGLNMAGRKVANAFAENAVGFQTVTTGQKSATNAIKQVYATMNRVVGDDINFLLH